MQSDYHRLALKETAPQLYHNHTVVKNVMKNLLKHSCNLKHDLYFTALPEHMQRNSIAKMYAVRVSLAHAILEGRTRHMRRINAHCRAGATKEVIPGSGTCTRSLLLIKQTNK